MAIFAPIIFSPMFLKNNNFFASQLLRNLAGYSAIIQVWIAYLDRIAFPTNKNLIETNGLTYITIQLFYFDDITF